jgi:two-component system NarL family response regulator
MSTRPIHVGVVHGDYVCRTGLATAFAAHDDMRVRTTTSDDPELLSCDVVVTDFDNGMCILAAMHVLKMNRPHTKIAIVANADREWQIRDALKHGAAAFLLLGADADELLVAVRTVHRGECHLSPSIAARLATSLATEPLTEREGQVLALLADGLCNKHIAARLEISLGTVKAHLRSAFDKLGVHSRTEAILMAERRGLLRQPLLLPVPREAPVTMARTGSPACLARDDAKRTDQSMPIVRARVSAPERFLTSSLP